MTAASDIEADKASVRLGCLSMASFVLIALGGGIVFGFGGFLCAVGLWLTIAGAGLSIELAIKKGK